MLSPLFPFFLFCSGFLSSKGSFGAHLFVLYGEVCGCYCCVYWPCGTMVDAEARSVDVALVGASGDMASLSITAPWNLLDGGA